MCPLRGVLVSTAPFIAVDWGTTNRRAYRIENGEVVATERDDQGILAVPAGGFPALVGELRARFDGLPVVMAGMVGSNRGWHDAGYVACPATIEALAAGVVTPEEGVSIVPGVCVDTESRADVMRGEEVQLLGAVAAGLAPVDALLCQPGTHNKWAVMKHGAIADFTTAMTGEMFALLKAHALIGGEMAGEVDAGDDFRQGVEACADTDLLAALFGVRAASVLGHRAPGAAAAYVSGLLIGSDCRARIAPGQQVHLLADGLLADLYSAAITIAGGEAVVVDSKASFVAGITRIRNLLP
ncbi:2-dehydro-3-deoxygalactonokinase [Novosphingobium sp. P6W]|uniref:2-dehydro-3-deoxygalactonokinase n=1 Tax=Novosphingobium sp. P6W TaxID=1609758 RepID=UPI0005C2C677|nr:2-dehydro-3-deoxygalactonokinase [Novosphingobium sp. P6W]AXB79820.1 2-oxo-3-deoxygalactonate kinase [Novosphingobium sp. P6W]KIS32245.1 2-oxo-3-deoxygalactonate kinase [Novosphingobium sp. P6W]